VLCRLSGRLRVTACPGTFSWRDLEPGRYLEMWLPSNLCHDQLSIDLEVEVVGTARPHVLLANGAAVEHTPGYRLERALPGNIHVTFAFASAGALGPGPGAADRRWCRLEAGGPG
jgi:hypothetical protein